MFKDFWFYFNSIPFFFAVLFIVFSIVYSNVGMIPFIDEEITETCSVTIKLSKRTQGFELLQKLKKNDHIICLEISRFSRSSLDLLKLVEKFKRLEVSCVVGVQNFEKRN